MKIALGVIGLFFLLGTVFGGNLQQIGNWGTAEMVGFNLFSLLSIFGGGYLVYWSLIKKDEKKIDAEFKDKE